MTDLSISMHLLLIILAIVFAALATVGIPLGRINTLAAAFLCFFVSLVV